MRLSKTKQKNENKRFIFDCGCEIPGKDVRQERHRAYCPIHGVNTKRVAFVYKCLDCPTEFISTGANAERCPECGYKRKRELQKRIEATGGLRKGMLILEPIRKPDCQHYLSYCLPREADNENWSCRFCRKYKPADVDACEYVTANDPMRAAYAWPAVW